MIEILITLAIGLIAGLAGMLLWWALLSDWWHGGSRKRRCPKCAYDMSGVTSLKCPECGRTAKNERRLHRSRRRWRLGVVALVLLIGASLLPVGVTMYRFGWRSLLSAEQIALVAAYRGQWEYAGSMWGGQPGELSNPNRWALSKAIHVYLDVPGALENRQFNSQLREELARRNPVITLAEVEVRARANEKATAAARGPGATSIAGSRRTADEFIAQLQEWPGFLTTPLSWEEWASQDPSIGKPWQSTSHLDPPMTISIDAAVDRMLRCTQDANELLNVVAMLRKVGREDVLDAYWEKCKPMSVETATLAAVALCYDIARSPITDRQRQIAAEAIALAPNDARGLRRLSGLISYISDPEPVLYALIERCTPQEFSQAADPAVFRLPAIRSSHRIFRVLASHRHGLPVNPIIDDILLRMDLSPQQALLLMDQGTTAERSAVLLVVARRGFLSNEDVFAPLRPIVLEILADESQSVVDRMHALIAIHNRTPEDKRFVPIAPW
ncbi:MAG: hypothetical protein K2X32_08430 [Phycisphaerales bacterium]|nr:hypothetical protein [Phycisphaerales bacterium]